MDVRIAILFFATLIREPDEIYSDMAGLVVEVGCKGDLENDEPNDAGEFELAGFIVGILAFGVALFY